MRAEDGRQLCNSMWPSRTRTRKRGTERNGDEVCVCGWPIAYWLKLLTRDHVVESTFVSEPCTSHPQPCAFNLDPMGTA